MGFILNLTQYKATPYQAYKGVRDLNEEDFVLLKNLLTFEEDERVPTKRDIAVRAMQIAVLAVKAAECEDCARIGGHCGGSCTGASNWFQGRALVEGPGYMLPELVKALKAVRFYVVQPYTEGVVTETITPDGEVTRTTVFRHIGFVEC